MALPDIILNRPWILVTLANTSTGINDSQAFGWSFGIVEMVFQTCDKCAVGDSVLFQPEKAIKLVYGSTIYLMIEESNSAFSEVILP